VLIDASLDRAAAAYASKVVRRLHSLLDAKLHAAYLIGSLALGDYVPGRSDIDIMAVVEERLFTEVKREIVRALSHPALPCPARGLEFVLY
jgi:predicted nucleotidyltransferase